MKLRNRFNEPERKAWHDYEKEARREQIKSIVKTVLKVALVICVVVFAKGAVDDWQNQELMREAESKIQTNRTHVDVGGSGMSSADLHPIEVTKEPVEGTGTLIVTCTECGVSWHATEQGELLSGLDENGNAVPFGTSSCRHQTIATDPVTGKKSMPCLEPACKGSVPVSD